MPIFSSPNATAKKSELCEIERCLASFMKGFPDKGKEKRAVGYYVGKHINLTHVDGAVNAGGNDLIFDNLLNLQNGISTYNRPYEQDNR